MSTKTYLLAVALLFGGALPAAADHGQTEYVPGRRALEIHEFMPQSGAVGSLITVRGQGLRQVEYALVGGYKVTPEHVSGQELSFRVPGQHGNGAISLYTRDGSTVRVGKFTVFSMLGIDGFSPRSGKAGTLVEIRGRGFQHGDAVYMNGRALPVQRLTDERITVRIPGDASTDYLTVSRHGGVHERSAQRFRVMQAEPVIRSVAPQGGLPGTKVRISGHGFGSGCKVFYGQEKLPIVRYGHGSIDARIPEYAQEDAYLYVNCAGEQGRSPYRFQLESYHAPELTDMQPRRGRAGSRVVLHGRKLGKVDGVFLRGVSLPIVQRRGKTLELEIPYGAQSGAISLQTQERLQQTPFQFQVLSAPQIHGFAPATVRPGQELTIHGRDFGADANVLIGGYQATIISRSSNELRVYVPAQMDPGKETVRVLSQGTDTTAAQRVYVRRGAEIARVSPGRVLSGGIIVIRGQGFDGATRVFWGQHELRVVRRSGNGKRIEVLAPSHVHGTDYVSIDDGFGQTRAQQALTVIERGPRTRDHRHGHANG